MSDSNLKIYKAIIQEVYGPEPKRQVEYLVLSSNMFSAMNKVKEKISTQFVGSNFKFLSIVPANVNILVDNPGEQKCAI